LAALCIFYAISLLNVIVDVKHATTEMTHHLSKIKKAKKISNEIYIDSKNTFAKNINNSNNNSSNNNNNNNKEYQIQFQKGLNFS